MADLEKVLGKTGAKNFWDKVWSNVKVLTGDVAYKTKGDLQTQVNAVSETASTAKSTADDAKTAASDAAKAASTAKETADAAKAAIEAQNKNFGGLTFGQDESGVWGYKVGGADPVIPFKTADFMSGVIDIQDADNHKISLGFKPKFVCVINEKALASTSNNIQYAIVSVYMEYFSDTLVWQNLKYASDSYHQLIDMDTANKSGMLPILRGILDDGFNVSLEALTRTVSYVSRFYGNYYWYAGA